VKVKLLFYYPSNKRSNALETLLLELKKNYHLICLTTCEEGPLHDFFNNSGITSYTNNIKKKPSPVYYLRQIIFLAGFCRKQKIDIVFSHLQHANFISVLSQFFCQSHFIIFRHHFKFNIFSNDKTVSENKIETLFDRIINKFAKKIIVPSTGVYNGMLLTEKVDKTKIQIIPYLYDFEKYNQPQPNLVEEIKRKYDCELLVLMCSRLIKFKRPHIVYPIIKKLITEDKLNIKLIALDEGPEKNNLKNYIESNNLQNHIFLLGYKSDFVNYMAAADLLIHPSLTEASSSTVKEMGLLKKAVAVCSKVGDFDDYILDNENGFLMSPVDTEKEIERVIKVAYHNKSNLKQLGINLNKTIVSKFNKSQSIINEYDTLIKETLKR